jgi:hypothetical protein
MSWLRLCARLKHCRIWSSDVFNEHDNKSLGSIKSGEFLEQPTFLTRIRECSVRLPAGT